MLSNSSTCLPSPLASYAAGYGSLHQPWRYIPPAAAAAGVSNNFSLFSPSPEEERASGAVAATAESAAAVVLDDPERPQLNARVEAAAREATNLSIPAAPKTSAKTDERQDTQTSIQSLKQRIS